MSTTLDRALTRMCLLLDFLAGRADSLDGDDAEKILLNFLHALSIEKSGLRQTISQLYAHIALRVPLRKATP